MTPQERDLILAVAQRLRNANLPQKDPEAERLIQTEIGSQRDALYLLTQAVIVQEQGLRQAQERIQQLESASTAGHGSFLGGLFGGGGSPPPPPAPPPQPAQGGGIGTFLGTAAASAAGAIGGHLIFDGLRRLAGSGPGVSWPQTGPAMGGNAPAAFNEPSRSGGWTASPATPRDTDSSGSGGDFDESNDQGGSGGDFDTEEEDTGSGGDFEDSDDSDEDFDDDSSDDDSGGGDF